MFNVKNDKRRYAYAENPMLKKKEIGNYSYLLSNAIGEGFSSVVYKGKDERSDEQVAVKVIERRLLANDIQKEMLLEEINILKSIEHRNIIRCYDVLHTQNNTYIITEYCNEGDLSQTLSRHSRLQEQDLVNILKDIISGFLYLAENGIVHRDLKPANLFIRDGVVKIGDFGFAKRVEAAPRSSENVGTPFYMAPEALKDSVYSIKSDIFAIGALTYQLLYGRPPWKADTEQKLYQLMISTVPQYSVSRTPKLNSFIQRCLTVNPAQRMDVEELVQWHINFCNLSRETASTNQSSLTVLRPRESAFLKISLPNYVQYLQDVILISEGDASFLPLVDAARHVQKLLDSNIRCELWESSCIRLFSAAQSLLRNELHLLGTNRCKEQAVRSVHKFYQGTKLLVNSLYSLQPGFEGEQLSIEQIGVQVLAGKI